MERPVIVIGGGGHAAVVIDALLACGRTVLGVVERDPGTYGGEAPLGVAVIGDDDAVARHPPAAVCLANGIGGAGSTAVRRAAFERFAARGYDFATICHPSAVVARGVTLGPGAQIMAGAVVQPGTTIGANAIVNTGARVDHDCRIGAHVHIAPGAVLCGGVGVGDGAHIGAGATVRQGLRIGAGALVGLGAAVVDAVPDGATVVGVPARVVR